MHWRGGREVEGGRGSDEKGGSYGGRGGGGVGAGLGGWKGRDISQRSHTLPTSRRKV